jgi:hypothetical protein
MTGDKQSGSTDGSVADECHHSEHHRKEACPHRLHEKYALFPCGVSERTRFRSVHGKGLFNEDVLARLDGEKRRVDTHRVRCRDVDDIHLWVIHQIRVASVTSGDGEAITECARGFLVSGTYGRDSEARRKEILYLKVLD